MYTQEEILKMLQSGQDADALAQDFVASLNAAVNSLKEEKEKEKEKEKEAKLQDAGIILDAVFNFIDKYYSHLGFEDMRNDVTAEMVVDAFDTAAAEILPALDLLKSLKTAVPFTPSPKSEVEIPKGHIQLKGEQDAIEAFLTQFGLK